MSKENKWNEIEENMKDIELDEDFQSIAKYIFENGGFEGKGVKRIKIFSDFEGKIEKTIIEKAIKKLFDMEMVKGIEQTYMQLSNFFVLFLFLIYFAKVI